MTRGSLVPIETEVKNVPVNFAPEIGEEEEKRVDVEVVPVLDSSVVILPVGETLSIVEGLSKAKKMASA